MAKVIFGNHSSVLVPRQDRDGIRKFYCEVLGGKVTKADPERDFIRLEEDFYIVFLYGDVADESELRYRTLTSTSRLQEANASGWSESTRSSPFMRGPEKARTWQR
jgi:hypothetical protein